VRVGSERDANIAVPHQALDAKGRLQRDAADELMGVVRAYLKIADPRGPDYAPTGIHPLDVASDKREKSAVLQVVRRVSSRVIAALLALSMAATAFSAVPAADSCCCRQTQVRCHCPVCEHAREMESGFRRVQQCSESHLAARLPALPDLFPPLSEHAFPLPVIAPATRPLFSPSEPPPLEVRTPPPLA
jgi:hypothetical protein